MKERSLNKLLHVIVDKVDWTTLLVLLGLGIFALVFFRGPIRRLLGYVRIERGQILFGPPQSSAERDPQAAAERLMRAFDNALLVGQETTIRDELRRDNLLDKMEAIPVLVRHLAATQVAYAFETFYRTIYGSQLRFLEFLNQQPTGVAHDQAQTFFTAVAALHPQVYNGWNLAGWLRWMLNATLIQDDNGVLQITARGRQFLAYLTNLGLGRNLPY